MKNGEAKTSIPRPAQLHSATLADVLDGLGLFGGFPSAIRALHKTPVRVLGRAYTVRWVPVRKSKNIAAMQDSTWSQVKDFLAPRCPNGAGRVYVAGTDTGALVTELALAGGFSASDLRSRSFTALLLGGAIRDAHVVIDLGLPVWATGFMPGDTQGSYRVAECGTWCNIGGQRVHSGDWIFADDTGVICIPEAVGERVFRLTEETEAAETQLSEAIAGGATLYDAVARIGRL